MVQNINFSSQLSLLKFYPQTNLKSLLTNPISFLLNLKHSFRCKRNIFLKINFTKTYLDHFTDNSPPLSFHNWILVPSCARWFSQSLSEWGFSHLMTQVSKERPASSFSLMLLPDPSRTMLVLKILLWHWGQPELHLVTVTTDLLVSPSLLEKKL